METIRFNYDREKALQASLWLLRRLGGAMDKMKLIKLMFLADRAHLFDHARPIVGGRYFAMQHGPVCSELLDEINASTTAEGPLRLENNRRVHAAQDVDDDVLSESDRDALEWVAAQYGNMDASRLRNLTHGMESWKHNEPQGESKRSALPYEDFFLDHPDRAKAGDILDIIREDQETRRMFE